jgi:hypothetical protein
VSGQGGGTSGHFVHHWYQWTKVPGIEGWAAVENTMCFGQKKTDSPLPFAMITFGSEVEFSRSTLKRNLIGQNVQNILICSGSA